MLEVPAVNDEYKLEFKSEKDGFITGISYSQSSWNYEDNWCLDINDKRIFNNIYTKEYGEDYEEIFNLEADLKILKNLGFKITHKGKKGHNYRVEIDNGRFEVGLYKKERYYLCTASNKRKGIRLTNKFTMS